jgi:hypothetical protein
MIMQYLFATLEPEETRAMPIRTKSERAPLCGTRDDGSRVIPDGRKRWVNPRVADISLMWFRWTAFYGSNLPELDFRPDRDYLHGWSGRWPTAFWIPMLAAFNTYIVVAANP